VFESLAVTNKPRQGEAARVAAVFRNTGEIETTARFVGELDRDGHAVREVTSVPQLVEIGDTRTIEMFVPMDAKGHYTLQGRINFDGRQSDGRLTAFRVDIRPSRLAELSAGAAALALIIVGGWWLLRRRRVRRTTLSDRLRSVRAAAASEPTSAGSPPTRSRRDAHVRGHSHRRATPTRRGAGDPRRRVAGR
jgi:hypothetical protein